MVGSRLGATAHIGLAAHLILQTGTAQQLVVGHIVFAVCLAVDAKRLDVAIFIAVGRG